MFAITRSVEDKIAALECAYLKDSDLFSLEQYATGFAERLKTYEMLRDHADQIANGALELLARDYPALMQKRGDRCKYDIHEVLRYMASSILRNDEHYFRDQMVDWLNTILVSYQVTTECAAAYSHLYEVISQVLPAKCAALAKPYTDMVVGTLRGAY
ncbi:Phycocyanin [Thalassoporum mexicanum PCC 7367]|uniref:phycocyanin n=1 Tax=Thalassoporum mexicanum TaxID=3457544 RepID=UPI00029FAED9|nr:phycocyanin [Pseudanabaena sp. PCC 7367]AFY70255.1 Phycocyanin [Pseudanabaena sp. PCC 7367]